MPDALDQLRQFPGALPAAPESMEQLERRVVRNRRRRRRSRALASVVLIVSIVAVVFVAVEERDSNEVHTVGQPPNTSTSTTTTVTPVTNPLPFASQSVISSDAGIDLVAASGEVKRLYDKPTALALALGDALVVAQGTEAGNFFPPRPTGPILVFDRGGKRALPSEGAGYLTLFDVGVVDDAAVALVASTTGTGPQDTNDELLLINLESGARTDLGSVGGWESGVVQGRLLADRVVLLQQASVSFSAESRGLGGGVQWHVDVNPPETDTSIAVVDSHLLVLHPMLAITRLDLATGAEINPSMPQGLSQAPPLDGFCFEADSIGSSLLCNQSSGGPLLIDVATNQTTPLGPFTAGVATATRPKAALKVFDQTEATWGGTIVFLDDGTFRPDAAFDTWLDAQRPASAEVAARALLDVTVSAASQTAGNPTTVTLTIEGFADDSVSGIRYTVTLELSSDRPIHFVSGTWGYRCARGGDTTSFLPRICP